MTNIVRYFQFDLSQLLWSHEKLPCLYAVDALGSCGSGIWRQPVRSALSLLHSVWGFSWDNQIVGASATRVPEVFLHSCFVSPWGLFFDCFRVGRLAMHVELPVHVGVNLEGRHPDNQEAFALAFILYSEVTYYYCYFFTLFFFFLAVLGFEHKASHLLGRHSAT
jgi:hypothetical protein